MTHIVQLTLPEKDRPYTQEDMDVVIGHPIRLNMSVQGERDHFMSGIVTDATINSDGSATVTMRVRHIGSVSTAE